MIREWTIFIYKYNVNYFLNYNRECRLFSMKRSNILYFEFLFVCLFVTLYAHRSEAITKILMKCNPIITNHIMDKHLGYFLSHKTEGILRERG